MDDRQDPALYSVYRPDQLDFRLPDVLHDALYFQLLERPRLVPYRLVCGVALHPDADHPYHSHQQDPVHSKPGQLAAHPPFLNHRRGRRLAYGFALGRYARIRPAPAAVLAVSGHHAAGLCDSDTGGEDLVCSQVWRMMAVASGMHSLSKKPQEGIPERATCMTDTDGRQHRFILQRIAHRALLERGLVPDFPPETLAELDQIHGSATRTEESTRDLRNLFWCSIDNDDSRDLDQLTVAEAMPDGAAKVLVA